MLNDSSSAVSAVQITVPRHHEILRLLEQSGHLTIGQITSALGVSEQTVRRDLKKLEQMNLLSRFHGGANSLSQVLEDTPSLVNKDIRLREISYVQEKEAMAAAVAKLIPDGSTVFITIGTTVERIAMALADKKDLFVITNSLRVAGFLYSANSLRVMLPSGQVRASNGGIRGPRTISDLEGFMPDFMITSVGAVQNDGTMLDFNVGDVEAAKLMMKNSKHTIIAADHSKFSAAASVRLGRISDVDYLVTDKMPEENIKEILENGNVSLILATPGRD